VALFPAGSAQAAAAAKRSAPAPAITVVGMLTPAS